jgi:hypothetical protein
MMDFRWPYQVALPESETLGARCHNVHNFCRDLSLYRRNIQSCVNNRGADRFLLFGSRNFVLAFGVVAVCYFSGATFSLEVMAR